MSSRFLKFIKQNTRSSTIMKQIHKQKYTTFASVALPIERLHRQRPRNPSTKTRMVDKIFTNHEEDAQKQFCLRGNSSGESSAAAPPSYRSVSETFHMEPGKFKVQGPVNLTIRPGACQPRQRPSDIKLAIICCNVVPNSALTRMHETAMALPWPLRNLGHPKCKKCDFAENRAARTSL